VPESPAISNPSKVRTDLTNAVVATLVELSEVACVVPITPSCKIEVAVIVPVTFPFTFTLIVEGSPIVKVWLEATVSISLAVP
jgi:hypothetical protein